MKEMCIVNSILWTEKNKKRSRQVQWLFKGYPHPTSATKGSISCPLLISVSEELSLNSQKNKNSHCPVMPKMPANHREVKTCEDEQQGSAKERSVQSCSEYFCQERTSAVLLPQSLNPILLVPNSNSSQDVWLKHSWDTAALPEAHPVQPSSSHSSHCFIANEIINKGHCTLSYISAQSFCSRPGTLHTPQVRSLLRSSQLCSCSITTGAMPMHPRGPQ